MSDPTFTKTPSKAKEWLVRSQGYRLLAVFLRHPKMGDGWEDLQENLKTYQGMLESLDVSWKNRMVGKIKKLGQIFPNVSLDSWAREYEFCFGHTAHSKISPYELEYGEEHSHREPQELADIAAFYQAFGLQISEKSHERGDHISIECEFMHFLIFKNVYAIEHNEKDHVSICEEAVLSFFSDHLAHWAPAFAMRLARISESEWMKGIADFCLMFIFTECEILSVDPGDENLSMRVIEEKVETGCVSCQFSPFSKDSGGGS